MTLLSLPVVSTDIAPGWRANVKIEAVIVIRDKPHAIVVIREEPDVVFGLRDEGQIYPPLDEPLIAATSSRSASA